VGTAIEKRARLCELQGNKMTSAMMEVDGQENAAPVMNDGGAARAKKNADGTDARKNQMWVEKYRPSRLADVAAHKDIIDTIGRLTKEDKLPHLLLYGPPGTGKTSTILAVAKELYGPAFAQMTLELNASDGASIARDPAPPALVFFKKAGEPERRTRHTQHASNLPLLESRSNLFSPRRRRRLPLLLLADRGIDVVRNEIQSFASTMRFNATGFKLIILDECDSMTKDAQFALRRVIEKYTKHTRFCLIGNYVSKIIPALQSRCTRFRFAPLGPESVRERVKHVVASEGVEITEEGLAAVQTLGAGDMRRTLNILQARSYSHWSPYDRVGVVNAVS